MLLGSFLLSFFLSFFLPTQGLYSQFGKFQSSHVFVCKCYDSLPMRPGAVVIDLGHFVILRTEPQ